MDEDTERLRDIFLEATGQERATDDQRADRGSLVDEPDSSDLPDVVATMRETFDFETDLDDETLATVVRLFYEGHDDAAIAARVGVDEWEVFAARTDLHLLREGDADPDALAALGEDEPARAESGDEERARERARRVARAQRRSQRASERFRTAFEERLTDADIEGKLVGEARADGLREAAEDIETDLQF